jgi:hypothetical protein
MVTDVSTSTLPPPVLDLDAFFDSVRCGAAFTADVKNIQAPFRSGLDSEDDPSRLFAFEEPPLGLRAVRVVANDAAQGERFMIPQNMRVPGSSVIRSLFEADGEWDAANREDLGKWSDSKGKWRGGQWRWRPAILSECTANEFNRPVQLGCG